MFDLLFIKIMNMSFTASIVIIFICLARLPLKKAPKIFSYALWGAALFRLICPFSFDSAYSLLPANADPIPPDIAYAAIPRIDTGIAIPDQTVNASLPAATPFISVNPLQIWLFLGRSVWLAGIAALLIWNMASWIRLRGRLKGAVCEKDAVYICTGIASPFVMGLLHPRIYLPAGLSPEEKKYILLHEQIHIKRLDHAIRPLCFFVLCLHWFNPFVWAAFFLSGRDMEMSCDECVIRKSGVAVRKEYSCILLALATGKRIISGMPPAFGEGDTASRIKNILHYKKLPTAVILATAAAVAAICIGLAVNPEPTGPNTENSSNMTLTPDDEVLEKDRAARLQLQTRLLAMINQIEDFSASTLLIDFNSLDGRLSAYLTLSAAPGQDLQPDYQEGIKKLVLSSVPNLDMDQIFLSVSPYLTTLTRYGQTGETLETNQLSNPRIATELAALLLTGTDKTQQSIHSVPTDATEYIKLELGDTEKTWFVYQAQDAFWVEKPYDYKRELDEKTYRAIEAYLYKQQSSHSSPSAGPANR